MPSTGTAPARVSPAPAGVNADHDRVVPKPEVPARVREGAYWFFWIVGLVVWNSLSTIMGSHLHHFTGLGVTGVIEKLARPSGIGGAMQVIVTGWVAGGFLFVGVCAADGKKWAFEVGMALYAVDLALTIAAGDYLSGAFHAGILYAIYRGFAALGKPANSERPDASSAAHAG
jgi:hypothetical protein